MHIRSWFKNAITTNFVTVLDFFLVGGQKLVASDDDLTGLCSLGECRCVCRSAVFNLLIIIALTAALAGQVISTRSTPSAYGAPPPPPSENDLVKLAAW